MRPLIETPHVPPQRIITGHFVEGTGYFAYRPGGTRDWLLIYTVAGHGRFGYALRDGQGDGRGEGGESGEITTEPGDAVLLPPGVLHDYGIANGAKQWDLLWAHFHPRPEWAPWLSWPSAAEGAAGLLRLRIARPAARRRVEAALAKMHRRALGPHRLRTSMAMNALEEALLWCDTESPLASTTAPDPRIAQAQEYLCEHLKTTVSLDDVAAEVGLSVSRLSYLFRRETRLTPQRYYEQQRLERAKQLLEITDLPIKQIAAEVGFANPFYFTLRFKAATGQSPRAYRRRKGG